MKRAEKILSVVILVSLLMKFAFIPLGNVLLVFSISLLTLIYYSLGFAFFNNIRLRKIFDKDSYKETTTLRIVGAIGVGMGLSAVLVGILFKFNRYPGADTSLIAGLVLTAIIVVIALIKNAKSKSEYYKRIIIRAIIIGGLGLVMALLPKMAITEFQYRNYPDYIEAYEYHVNHPEDVKAYEKHQIEYHRVILPPIEFDMYMEENYPNFEND